MVQVMEVRIVCLRTLSAASLCAQMQQSSPISRRNFLGETLEQVAKLAKFSKKLADGDASPADGDTWRAKLAKARKRLAKLDPVEHLRIRELLLRRGTCGSLDVASSAANGPSKQAVCGIVVVFLGR